MNPPTTGSGLPSEDNRVINPAQVQRAANDHSNHLVTPAKAALPNRQRKATKAIASSISIEYLEDPTPTERFSQNLVTEYSDSHIARP